MSQNEWDSSRYDRTVGYVPTLAAGVVELLAPQARETILDLGCGTGHLTAKIAESGACVLGFDSAPGMIEHARRLYPHIRYELADGHDFTLDMPVEAVFSNAALHWMKRPAQVIASVYRALKPGGRFVAEFGGKGNVAVLVDALYRALEEEGIARPDRLSPWYFPSVAEYATLLETGGLEVSLIYTFERPTPLDDCPEGAADWVRMFGGDFVKAVPADRAEAVIARVATLTRPALYRDGRWFADYKRLRFVARKPLS